MKRFSFINYISIFLLFLSTSALAQSDQKDISLDELPENVKTLVTDYMQALQATNLDECAEKVSLLAGGGLVNDDGKTLRSSVKPFKLKKDFNNAKHYSYPISITKANVSENRTSGYGNSALKGKLYKVWVSKKNDTEHPAPISILVPDTEGKSPKVVGIGSL